MLDIVQIVDKLLSDLETESNRMKYRAEGVKLLYTRIVEEADARHKETSSEPEREAQGTQSEGTKAV